MGATALNAVQATAGDPFGAEGALRYDEDCAFAPSRYLLARDLQVAAVLRRLPAQHPVVIDLGCGTANDALELLAARQDLVVVGIDRSPHMLEVAATKIRRANYGARCHLFQADFRDIEAAAFQELLVGLGLGFPDCVLTSMTLHHYEAHEKLRLYGAIADMGSAFVVTDLFSSECPSEAAEALAQELQDLRGLPGSRSAGPTTLSKKHYVLDNRPDPLGVEIDRLRTSGFAAVDVVYRHGQVALLSCSTPATEVEPMTQDRGGAA